LSRIQPSLAQPLEVRAALIGGRIACNPQGR
jgi:hypothetical protein